MKSPSYHTFARVPSVSIPRSAFDMSCRYKTTFDSGKLIPCMAPIEILPGDSINLSIQSFARLTTPIVPFMDNLVMDYQFFFVPTRLVWSNFQKFMGEQENPGDSIDYVVPYVEAPESVGFEVGSIADYFGLPTGVPGIQVSALPFRAWNLIYNEWYRPELLANSVEVDKGDGPDDYDDYKSLLSRFNRLDYFQGAMPSPQKGPGVELPIAGGLQPVQYGKEPLALTPSIAGINWAVSASGTNSIRVSLPAGSTGKAVDQQTYNLKSIGLRPFYDSEVDNNSINFGLDFASSDSAAVTQDPNLFVNLDAVGTATINSLRQAFQVQLFLEREQLGGSRYTELLRSMFGVVSPDARLQRPEYLGGGSIPIVISTVPQTSSTDATSPQGNLAAFGLSKGRLPHIKKSFVEHGYVFGIVSVRSPITYQQGIDRMWSRKTRYDYYWPVFAHLGEQAILNKEIYAQGTDDDDAVFGYQERYAEYRYGISHVTGKLRSSVSDSLDYWHLGINYSQLPQLGEDFVKVNVPLSRVLAVQDEPQFVYDSLINCKMFRPMPLYGQPGRIDHFF